ncbi:hypothetical protein BDQ12DRAFT_727334 [Crucibulum laeve]|uniref:Uncharacterized protein n=1 Tax=Crucibulum laeve TaxID=68775 RepID=A0A5C3LMB0_9AGAR|nr:hypothetical protein BDQ12DRAFT_727334 [Crucibulum laeve]
MITGPSRVGKTAVTRDLADDSYSPFNSTPNPARKQLLVISRCAYMVTGSLLEQFSNRKRDSHCRA